MSDPHGMIRTTTTPQEKADPMTEQTESGPQVPPPAGTTRKLTAKETADQALEGVLALQSALSELEARIATAPAGANDDLTPPRTLKAITDLDRDMTALSEFVNQLAGKLDALPASGPVPALGEEVTAKTEALANLVGKELGELVERDAHLEQELGSLGRAVSTLTERLAELDARPAAEGGEDAFTARWNELARQVDRVLTEQREDTQRNLGALTERVDNLGRLMSTDGLPVLPGVTTGAPKVYGAMVQVMREVREVGKNGVGPREAGAYGYRKLDDAVDAVGAALREVGILLVPVEVVSHEIHQTVVPTKEGSRTWTTATVTMRWRYIHPEDGSSQDVVMAGEGRDMGDKATGKANSNAWKNALVQSLNIPVQGMPEVENEHPVIGAGQGQPDHMGNAADYRARAEAEERRFVARESAATPVQQPQGGQLTKDEAARRTVQALNNLSAVPPAERRAKLDAIADYARDQGLTDLVVDGVKVSQVIITVLATLVPDHAFSAPPGQRGPIANAPQQVMQRAEAQVQAAQAEEVRRMIQERDPNSTAAHVSGMVAQQAQQRASQFDPQAASQGRSGWTDPQPQQFPLPADEPPWEGNDGGAYYVGDRKADIPVNYP